MPKSRAHSVSSRRGDRRTGQVPELSRMPSAGYGRPYDADPAAPGLDLRQDVTREERCVPLRLHLPHAVLEHRLHQGSGPDVGSSRTSSSALDGRAATRPTFLPVALGVGAGLLRLVELEALQRLVAAPGVE